MGATLTKENTVRATMSMYCTGQRVW